MSLGENLFLRYLLHCAFYNHKYNTFAEQTTGLTFKSFIGLFNQLQNIALEYKEDNAVNRSNTSMDVKYFSFVLLQILHAKSKHIDNHYSKYKVTITEAKNPDWYLFRWYIVQIIDIYFNPRTFTDEENDEIFHGFLKILEVLRGIPFSRDNYFKFQDEIRLEQFLGFPSIQKEPYFKILYWWIKIAREQGYDILEPLALTLCYSEDFFSSNDVILALSLLEKKLGITNKNLVDEWTHIYAQFKEKPMSDLFPNEK